MSSKGRERTERSNHRHRIWQNNFLLARPERTILARDFYQAAIARGIDRLRLVISSDDPRVLSWPWEALFDPAHQFIAQHCDIERKLTRDISDPPPLPDTLPRDRVNILLVTCRPGGDKDVGYRSISRSLVDIVHASDLPADVTVLRPPTFEQVDRLLSERPGVQRKSRWLARGQGARARVTFWNITRPFSWLSYLKIAYNCNPSVCSHLGL